MPRKSGRMRGDEAKGIFLGDKKSQLAGFVSAKRSHGCDVDGVDNIFAAAGRGWGDQLALISGGPAGENSVDCFARVGDEILVTHENEMFQRFQNQSGLITPPGGAAHGWVGDSGDFGKLKALPAREPGIVWATD